MADFEIETPILNEGEQWKIVNNDLKHHGLIPIDVQFSASGELYLNADQSGKLRHVISSLITDANRRQKLVHELLVTNQQLRLSSSSSSSKTNNNNNNSANDDHNFDETNRLKLKIAQLQEKLMLTAEQEENNYKNDDIIRDALETAERRTRRARSRANELEIELNRIKEKLKADSISNVHVSVDELVNFVREMECRLKLDKCSSGSSKCNSKWIRNTNRLNDDDGGDRNGYGNKCVYDVLCKFDEFERNYQRQYLALKTLCATYLPKLNLEKNLTTNNNNNNTNNNITEMIIEAIEENKYNCKELSKNVPNDVLRQIVNHLMTVFDLNNIGGIYAAINGIFTKLSEYSNVSKELGRMLGIGERVSSFQLVEAVTDLLAISRDKAINRVCDSLGILNLDEAINMVRKQEELLPIYKDILERLLDLLNVQKYEDIVPAVKTLKFK